ncbi:MAG: hypothetical protein D6813_01370 [Calditrichaeota bacterium]|nr:MAG: hypothetical protein D6813_01370 [Calditrichota bacterium]
MIKKTSTWHVFVVMVILIMAYAGCQNLDVQNLNEPDTQRALAQPGDVESLIAGSILQWFLIHNQWGIEHLIVTADALTCSWGNYAMKDMSSEPRIAFPNNTSYRYINAITVPWQRCYRAISAASDGLRQINNGLIIENEVKTHRAKAIAKLVQGLALGYLACFYDRAFILDENINLEDLEISFDKYAPYNEVMDAAVTKLEEAIDLLENGPPFETEEGWINGVIMNNVQLAEVAHSYIARYLAQVARNPEERAAVDWSKVRFHAERGVKEPFAPHGDGSFDGWFHSPQWFHNDRGASWARLDYKMIGPSDKSGKYQQWLDTPVQQRNEFDMDTDDKRLWDGTYDENGRQNPGIYAGNWGPSPFRANRGTYHFSKYGYYRYEDYALGGNVGPSPIFLPEENDFLIAEALLWTGGSDAEIAAIIDKTRVNNGGYPPALEVYSGRGSVTDKRSPLPGASLWAMLKYEKHIEILMTGAGVEFFDNRGWGDLVTNTPVHFPVPARELEILEVKPYTFGGGGEGSAPKVNMIPGPPE